MNPPFGQVIRFRLGSSALSDAVDVALRRVGDRWVAVADIAGHRQTGLGVTPGGALAASLGQLSAEHRTALLADPALLGPSRELHLLGAS